MLLLKELISVNHTFNHTQKIACLCVWLLIFVSACVEVMMKCLMRKQASQLPVGLCNVM